MGKTHKGWAPAEPNQAQKKGLNGAPGTLKREKIYREGRKDPQKGFTTEGTESTEKDVGIDDSLCSSIVAGLILRDRVPQGLKPAYFQPVVGTAEAVT
jgi:hypothetical protein